MSTVRDNFKFYYNPKEGTYRVVKPIKPSIFAVVKIFGDDARYTLKFWKGDLEKTASFWNTKPFQPDDTLRKSLIKSFIRIYNTFKVVI